MFAYCRNNPVNRFDENGYRDEELLAFALADGPEPGPADVIAVAAYAVDNLAPIIEEEGEVIYGDLEYAAEYGIKEYTSLVEDLMDTGLRAHHIVEKRFAVALNSIEKDFMDSVAVTKMNIKPLQMRGEKCFHMVKRIMYHCLKRKYGMPHN